MEVIIPKWSLFPYFVFVVNVLLTELLLWIDLFIRTPSGTITMELNNWNYFYSL